MKFTPKAALNSKLVLLTGNDQQGAIKTMIDQNEGTTLVIGSHP